MASWFIDEGLNTLIKEWKKVHPRATVYTIGDENHSKNPRETQHAPDDGKSGGPGDTKGEVDAGDFMPGGGVSDEDLDDLAEGLRLSRDPRLLIVIRRNKIFSSYPVSGVPAFTWRTYKGRYHGHTHVSVNDNFKNNTSNWEWEEDMPRTRTFSQMNGSMPDMEIRDEDSEFDGFDHVIRAQALLNVLERTLPPLNIDGVYGVKTAQKLAKLQKTREAKTTTNGSKIEVPEWRTLMGFV